MHMLSRVYNGYGMQMATTTFDVLADPSRRRILDLLLDGPRSVGELVDRLGMSQPRTSKHLRVLREAGVVEARKEAQRRVYELRPEPLAEVSAWLEPFRREWAGRLDALERHLDDKETP
jgi:DNA-binding transcriptional ArsR family regulator